MNARTMDSCHRSCEQYCHLLSNSVGSTKPADFLRSDDGEGASHGC